MNKHDTDTVTDVTPITASHGDGSLPLATSTSRQVAVTPDDLLSMAVQSGASMDMLERLMALKERADANNARRAFVEAMAEFKTEPLDIFKKKSVGFTTKEGDFVGYKHAELSDITDVVVPALARHGLSHRWQVKQEAGRITVICEVTHRAGHMESVLMDAAPDSSGKKNQIQQVASAITYLQRYTLLAVCGLATKSEHDDDGRGAGGDEGAESDVLNTLLEDLKEKMTDEDARLHYTSNVKKLGNVKLQSQFKAAVVKHRDSLKAAGATA